MNKYCKCGCEQLVKPGNTWINGHNRPTLGRIPKNKGKSNKEYYGDEKSKEISKKIRITKLGKKNPAKRPEVKEKISKNRKGKLLGENNPNYWKGKRNPGQSKRMKLNNPSFREDVKEKIRNSALKRWKELGSIKIGKMESKILNETETILNYKILRQYSVKGFSVDGYIPELNLVIEIDEKHHYINGKLRDKDINRQKVIEKELKCIFLRIKDDISEDELKKALNEIKKD